MRLSARHKVKAEKEHGVCSYVFPLEAAPCTTTVLAPKSLFLISTTPVSCATMSTSFCSHFSTSFHVLQDFLSYYPFLSTIYTCRSSALFQSLANSLPVCSSEELYYASLYCFIRSILSLINSDELSPPRDATSYVATPEVYSIPWNPKIHYSLHKSPKLVPIYSVDTTPPILFLQDPS